jgi:hypothetical protein
VPHARGGLGQAQGQRRLGVGELLEMAEQEDLAIRVIEAVEGGMEPALELTAHRQGRGRERRVPELAGKVERRPIGERAGAGRSGEQRWNGTAGLRR